MRLFRKKRLQNDCERESEERVPFYLPCIYMKEINYLTIVTDRMKYFEGLQERTFQELGLLIDLVHFWEEKNLQGNLVWDFSENLQKEDCYPKGSLCFVPHKEEWKVKKLRSACPEITVVTIAAVETPGGTISPSMAESLLVPAGFPFRETRCQDLKIWCGKKKWMVKMNVQKGEKP